MRQELQCVLDIVRIVPATDLPRLLGELEEVRTTALARLSAPVPIKASDDRTGDDVLDVAQAAAYINMSQKWIYRNHSILPHLRVGFGTRPRLKFRRRDLDGWLEKHKIER
jgi:hypothetical protein